MPNILGTKSTNYFASGAFARPFLELVGARLSVSDVPDEAYVEVSDIFNVFKISDYFEVGIQELMELLLKIEKFDLGVKAKGIVTYYPEYPENERIISIVDAGGLKDADPSINSILFSVDLEKFSRALTDGTGSGFKFGKEHLEFNGNKVGVSATKNSRPFFLLKLLLQEPGRTWNYDEVWEFLFGDENYDSKNWKAIYNAASDLNSKIAEQTTVRDLIEASKTTIKINSKYLS